MYYTLEALRTIFSDKVADKITEAIENEQEPEGLTPKEYKAYLKVKAKYNKLQKRLYKAYRKYLAHAGETEARNVMTRMNWGKKRRHSTPLDESEDIPRIEQIVKRKHKLPFTGMNHAKTITADMPDESYNQVIGRKGALALSETTGDFMIKLNLKRAELMTKAGKTPQQIRLATGWELAQDNEWRYEIPDGKILQKEIKKILPRIDKSFRFRKIFTKKQLEQNLPVSAKLGDFFDAPELFTAYPQLKDMIVTFKNEIQGGKFSGLAYGIKPVDGTNIDLDANLNLPEMQSVLLHEVQHIIQEIEGFARGGTDEAGTLSGSVANNVASELIFRLLKNVSSQGQRIATMYLKNNFKKADKLAANLPENERKILSNVKKIVQQIRHNKSLRLSNIYPFLGGEVEARNVQRRENLTPEQRRSTLLSETEDVHSWIVRKNSSASGQASSSHTSNNTADESYQQIAGEKGARKLDKTEGVTTRMDNLKIAQKMTKAGKDAKTIWLATGWQADPNGDWQYELPDGDIKPDLVLKGEIDKSSDEPMLTAKSTLGEVLVNADEIFTAYPQLRKMPVEFVHTELSEGGYYSPSRKLIGIENYLSHDGKNLYLKVAEDRFITSLIHEMQHAIQRIEGFAQGTSPEKIVDEKYRTAIREINEQIDKLDKEKNQEEITRLKKAKKALWRERNKTIARVIDNPFADEDIIRQYYDNRGEMQARNAEHRYYLSNEEARNTPLSDTEDTYDSYFSHDTDEESYKQAAYSPRGFMRKIIDKVTSTAKKMFTPSVKSAPNIDAESLRFANEETERRYRDSLKGVQQLGLLGKIKHSTMGLIQSMKGDFPELSGDAMKFAKEQFRMLQRKKSSQVKQAMQTFTENLRGLDTYQRTCSAGKDCLMTSCGAKRITLTLNCPSGSLTKCSRKKLNVSINSSRVKAQLLRPSNAKSRLCRISPMSSSL